MSDRVGLRLGYSQSSIFSWGRDPDQDYEELPPAWQHQVMEVPSLIQGSYSLLWEPRTGKTRACGEAIRILAAENRIDGLLVLCPVNAKDVWGRNLEVFLPHWPQFECTGLQSKPIPLESRAIICNPNILIPQGRSGRSFSGWHGELVRWMGSRRIVLIEDESHLFFSNVMSPTYKAGRSLSRLADRVWPLTGTPTEKSGLELHWQLCHLGPKYPFLWLTRDQFGKKFCEATENKFRGRRVIGHRRDGSTYDRPLGGWDYGMVKNPDGLWQELQGVADRRLRKDCLDVPMTRRMDVWSGDYHQDHSTPGEWAANRRAMLDHQVGITVDYVRELLEQGVRPIVVGGFHREFTEKVSRKLQAPLVRGGISGHSRAAIYNDFQAGKTDVLVGNIRAMGTSIELSRAHHAVIGEIDWNARDLRQFEDRLTGSNQTEEVLIHYLLTRHSVAEDIWDTVLMKGKAMDDLDEAARRLRQILDQYTGLLEDKPDG